MQNSEWPSAATTDYSSSNPVTNTAMADTATKTNTRSKASLLQRTTFGSIINIDFFLRNWLIVLLVVGLVIFYISGKYMVQTNRAEIKKLEHRLEVVETECIRTRENYMSRIRESNLIEMVDTAHLYLRVQDKKPYKMK